MSENVHIARPLPREGVLSAWRRLDLPVTATLGCAILLIAALFGDWLAPYAKDATDLSAPASCRLPGRTAAARSISSAPTNWDATSSRA